MGILVTQMPLQVPADSAAGQTPLTQLVMRLRQGDAQALEPLIERTEKMAFRLACSILGDSHQAEDVLQDVYLTVYRQIGQLRQPEAFQGWFCRILVHRCQRVRRVRQPESLDELTVEPSQPCDSARVDERLAVERVLGSLSSKDRTVLALRDVLQLSYDEIAAALNVPLSTVKTRLFKARQRFLTFFQKGATP